MKVTKIAFVCQIGLDSFIEPVVKEFEKETYKETYQVRRYYCRTNQEVIAAVKWGDIIFLEWANEVSVVAAAVYDIKKKGVIVRLHSYESLADYPTQIDWSRVDYLVFVAPHIRAIVEQTIPNLQEQVATRIIPNGLDIDAIEPNKKLSRFDIAYVCNINHKKEPAMALQIMEYLVNEFSDKFKLHIAGAHQDKRYKLYMEHIAKEMGIEDNILYYGHVADMNEFWEGKGTILSTSIHEGHPLNIMEGVARGLRPVIHNFMGAKDLYPDSWVFNTVGEAVELITMTDTIFGTPETETYRQELVNRGWTTDNQMAQFKKLFDTLAAAPEKTEETAEYLHEHRMASGTEVSPAPEKTDAGDLMARYYSKATDGVICTGQPIPMPEAKDITASVLDGSIKIVDGEDETDEH